MANHRRRLQASLAGWVGDARGGLFSSARGPGGAGTLAKP